MPGSDRLDPRACEDIVQRLKRIEGQARGIQRMVDEGRDCHDIMTQMAAMRAATQSVTIRMLEEFALHCLRNPDEFASPEQSVADMIGVVTRLTR